MKKVIVLLVAIKSFLVENWFKVLILSCLLLFILQLNHLAKTFISQQNDLGLRQQEKLSQQENRLAESDLFSRKAKCQEMVTVFKTRYNNVTGGSFDTISNTCNIEYRKDDGKAYSTMDEMSDN